jgi:hypothetical protein
MQCCQVGLIRVTPQEVAGTVCCGQKIMRGTGLGGWGCLLTWQRWLGFWRMGASQGLSQGRSLWLMEDRLSA